MWVRRARRHCRTTPLGVMSRPARFSPSARRPVGVSPSPCARCIQLTLVCYVFAYVLPATAAQLGDLPAGRRMRSPSRASPSQDHRPLVETATAGRQTTPRGRTTTDTRLGMPKLCAPGPVTSARAPRACFSGLRSMSAHLGAALGGVADSLAVASRQRVRSSRRATCVRAAGRNAAGARAAVAAEGPTLLVKPTGKQASKSPCASLLGPR